MTATKKTQKTAGATRGSKTSKSDPKPPKAPAVAKAIPDGAEPELVVFAFRLTREERDVIHAATGPSKASKFVRSLAVAGARRDEDAIKEILAGLPSSAAA